MRTIVKSKLKYHYGGTVGSFFKLTSQSLAGKNYALAAGNIGEGVKMSVPTGNPNEVDDNMIWAFVDAGNGWSKIKNVFNGRTAALQAGGLRQGATMQRESDSPEQQWRATFTNSGLVILFNKASANQGYVFDSNNPNGGQTTNLGFPGPFINERATNGNTTPGENWEFTNVGVNDDQFKRIFGTDQGQSSFPQSFFKMTNKSLGDDFALAAPTPGEPVEMVKVDNKLDDSMIWTFVAEEGTGDIVKIRNLFAGPDFSLAKSLRRRAVPLDTMRKTNPGSGRQEYTTDWKIKKDGEFYEVNIANPLTKEGENETISPKLSGNLSITSDEWKLTPVGTHDDHYKRVFGNNHACGAVSAETGFCGAVASGAGACGAVAKIFGACGAVVGGAGACYTVLAGAGACGAVGSVAGACGIVASGAGACGLVGAGAGACGAVASIAAGCGAVFKSTGACAAVASGAGVCGAVASAEGACGAVVAGAGACGAVVKITGVCGGVAGGADACAAEADGAAACGAHTGVEGVGACGAHAGFCGLVACVAFPIGGNW